MANEAAVMAMLQAGRNQAIALVQLFEGAITLLDPDPAPRAQCVTCQSVNLKAFQTMGGGSVMCMDCGTEQTGKEESNG